MQTIFCQLSIPFVKSQHITGQICIDFIEGLVVLVLFVGIKGTYWHHGLTMAILGAKHDFADLL